MLLLVRGAMCLTTQIADVKGVLFHLRRIRSNLRTGNRLSLMARSSDGEIITMKYSKAIALGASVRLACLVVAHALESCAYPVKNHDTVSPFYDAIAFHD